MFYLLIYVFLTENVPFFIMLQNNNWVIYAVAWLVELFFNLDNFAFFPQFSAAKKFHVSFSIMVQIFLMLPNIR